MASTKNVSHACTLLEEGVDEEKIEQNDNLERYLTYLLEHMDESSVGLNNVESTTNLEDQTKIHLIFTIQKLTFISQKCHQKFECSENSAQKETLSNSITTN